MIILRTLARLSYVADNNAEEEYMKYSKLEKIFYWIWIFLFSICMTFLLIGFLYINLP